MRVTTLSAATSIRCILLARLVRRLMGSKICARAAMNDAKLPNVSETCLDWRSATAMLAPTVLEMHTWAHEKRRAACRATWRNDGETPGGDGSLIQNTEPYA